MVTQPVALPPKPRDYLVCRPMAPGFPPFRDVVDARMYLHDVEESFNNGSPYNCTEQDLKNAIQYEQSMQIQAAPFTSQDPEPPWFQAAWQQVIADFRNNLKFHLDGVIPSEFNKIANLRRGDGTVIAYDIVPFADGTNPTEPPHNLTPLRSLDVIGNLDENKLAAYLQGYGMNTLPTGANPIATDCLRKEILKGMMRGGMMHM